MDVSTISAMSVAGEEGGVAIGVRALTIPKGLPKVGNEIHFSVLFKLYGEQHETTF